MTHTTEVSGTANHPGSGDWLIGGGIMGQLIRSMDWSQTPLGPIDHWPASLRTTVSLAINSNFPISLAWGTHHTQIYNDGYWPICGDKHPYAMGQDFTECWASAWPAIGAAFDSALAGTTAFLEDQRMFLDRHGYLEETFFTFSFSPIYDQDGQVVGLFHPVTETTSKMVGERRTRILRDLGAHGFGAQTLESGQRQAAESLAQARFDLPFVLFYQLADDRQSARLVAQTGLVPGGVASPQTIDLTSHARSWPLAEAAASGGTVAVDDLHARFGDLICEPYPEPINTASVYAIMPPGQAQPVCYMVVGLSPRSPINEAYTSFCDLLASAVTTVIANAIAHQVERQRAEALEAIDRAKTAFFSNVSHEFRTPLTLLLGPLEDELAEQTDRLPATRRARLETAHRNSLRLLKLVNTLLDFTRLETGRMQAVYQPTDLAALTSALAGSFHAACERVGLQLQVDCAPLPQPVHVDHDMWEKIVLNLLSNALKFTFAGAISVKLLSLGRTVALTVQDTGVGIPANELSQIFDRFHRVKGTQGRSHEGTGIGLALVQELMTLHGGTIQASSVVGQGSTFTLTLPFGADHLPAEQISAESSWNETIPGARPFVEESLRWLATPEIELVGIAPETEQQTMTGRRGRIVWAEDNADMREYVLRLLQNQYAVEAVADGAEALAAVRRQPADLLLTDVMMPRLDGFSLLRELRADPQHNRMPIIMISARAGDEARIEGLERGADDYLVKPFSARELLARIATQMELAQLRRAWADKLEQQVAERTAVLVQTTDNLYREMAEHRQAVLALRQSQDRFELAFRSNPAAMSITRLRDGLYIDINESHERIFGYPRSEIIGQSAGGIAMYADPNQRAKVVEIMHEHGALRNAELTLRTKSGELREVICSLEVLEFDGEACILGSVFDITDRKRAEQAQLRSANRLRVLADASRSFVEIGAEYQLLLDTVVRTTANGVGDGSILFMLSDNAQQLELATMYDQAPEVLEIARMTLSGYSIQLDQPSMASRIVRDRQPLLIPILAEAQFDIMPKPQVLALLQRIDMQSLIIVPMRLQGQTLGMLCVYRYRADQPPFDENDLVLTQDLGDRAALAIGNLRLFKQVQHELSERTRAEALIRTLNEELEQRVIARTAELTLANNELEAFSYSISHDLRAPLRAINGFTRILLEGYGSELPADAQRYFQIVRENAQQMGHLIDDLLAFSRLSRQPLSKRLVDPDELIRQCLAELQAEQRERPIEILRTDLPLCQADPALLKQVWFNLLTNALKYTRRRDPALIELSAQIVGPETIYSVRDNGVGFDMRYKDKLFGVFQRMHRAEDYEGTGVGLAIVQRIIQRHGGRIWAEAAVDQGATFYFTLS